MPDYDDWADYEQTVAPAPLAEWVPESDTCEDCGAAVTSADVFCPLCGAKLVPF